MRVLKSLLLCLAVVVVMLIAASLFDIFLAVISSRFYNDFVIIVVFAVAGVFAAVGGMDYGVPEKENRRSKLATMSFLLMIGLLFFFILAPLEGGEYGTAFKSYGVGIAAMTLFLVREDIRG